jgi:hypothetical protein
MYSQNSGLAKASLHGYRNNGKGLYEKNWPGGDPSGLLLLGNTAKYQC